MCVLISKHIYIYYNLYIKDQSINSIVYLLYLVKEDEDGIIESAIHSNLIQSKTKNSTLDNPPSPHEVSRLLQITTRAKRLNHQLICIFEV